MTLTYEQWDFIADGYSPLLVILTLAIIIWRALPPRKHSVGSEITFLLSGLLVVYGLMGIDKQLGIWPALGLDYSTHTAFSVLFVTFLAYQGKLLALASLTSLLLYGALMLMQEYHTLGDMLSTVLVVLPVLLLLGYILTVKEDDKHLSRDTPKPT